MPKPKLRSQVTKSKVNSPAPQRLVNTQAGKLTDKVTSKQSLNKDGKSETRFYRGNMEVSPAESNVLRNKEKQKATHKMQDYNRSRPNAIVQGLMDPTGISQWGEAKLAAKDLMSMAGSAIGLKSKEGYKWDTSRAVGDAFDIIGAAPLFGKAKVASEGLKLAKSVSKPIIGQLAKSVAKHSAPTLGVVGTNEYIKSKSKKKR